MARKIYLNTFKLEAVRLLHEENLTVRRVAKDLGICRSTLKAWAVKAETGELDGSPMAPNSPASLQAEVKRLKKENRILKEEREILKKAAVFFAKETV